MHKHHTIKIKSKNEQEVINLIRINKMISGAELARITGLRPSTILNILNNLLKNNLIIDNGKGESTERGGKRPNLWKLNSSAGYVIGLDIEIGELNVVIMNLNGDTIVQKNFRTGLFKELSELIQFINLIVADVIKETEIDNNNILGMGIAYAGVVNSDTGVLVMGDVIPQLNIPLLLELAKYYNFPIKIENNANASAIGSLWVGSAKEKINFMSVLVEFDTNVSGIAIGLVLNGNLYHGKSYCAGEINAHLPKLYELLDDLRYRYQDSKIMGNYILNPDKVDIHSMIDAAKKGDETALKLFSVFGNLIGQTITKPIALMNPDAIIISGPISVLGDIIINPIRETIKNEILSISNNVLEIICDVQGDYAVANGAASIILHNFFTLYQ